MTTTTCSCTAAPALSLRGITVRYGALVANNNVSLDIEAGAVHAIVGENGAGKSTLMKAAFGLAPLLAGEVFVEGTKLVRPSPRAAIERGVGMVHQHFMLADTLTVAENIVLGAEPMHRRWVPSWLDKRRMNDEVAALAAKHGLAGDPRRLVRDLSVGEQQRVEILKVLYRGARVLILDEPTAVLTPPEADELFVVLRRLTQAGGTVVLITHKLDEVMAISSRVSVMRRGELVAGMATVDTTPAGLARAMVGRDLAGGNRHEPCSAGERLLQVDNVSTSLGAGRGHNVHELSFDVHAGEIVGIAGVEGNGQSTLIDVVSGTVRARVGKITLAGDDITHLSPAKRRDLGFGLVPEDRHRSGLLLDLSLCDNLLLGREKAYAWRGLGPINRRRLIDDARRLLQRHDVRPPDPTVPAVALSGGNQQKVIIAREIERNPRVLLAAQPTRGVDVGAIELIHGELETLRSEGRGILLVSADLDEILALCDRILVLLRGRIVARVTRAEASRALLGPLMTGAAATSSGALGAPGAPGSPGAPGVVA